MTKMILKFTKIIILKGFEYVDPNATSETIYFAALVEALLPLGYARGVNLLGSPVYLYYFYYILYIKTFFSLSLFLLYLFCYEYYLIYFFSMIGGCRPITCQHIFQI